MPGWDWSDSDDSSGMTTSSSESSGVTNSPSDSSSSSNSESEDSEEGPKHEWGFQSLVTVYAHYGFEDAQHFIAKAPAISRIEQQLIDAAAQGDLPLVRSLCSKRGVRVNCQGIYQASPLHRACYEGKTDIVRFLLGLEVIDCNLASRREKTPLFMACGNGHLEIVSLLLADERVDVNRGAMEGQPRSRWLVEVTPQR